MIWIVVALLMLVYILGFIAVLFGHLLFLQMITPELALFRAAVWPIFWATGWPRGEPVQMD